MVEGGGGCGDSGDEDGHFCWCWWRLYCWWERRVMVVGGSNRGRGEDNSSAGADGDSSDHRVDGDVTEVKKCDVIMGC